MLSGECEEEKPLPGSLSPPVTDSGMCGEQLDSTVSWKVPYKEPSIGQHRAPWLCAEANGQPHPVWKATALIQKGKNRSAQQAA